MTSDRKKLLTVSISIFALLFVTLFFRASTGRILAAIVLSAFAAACLLLIKKRAILSINKNQVLLIFSVSGLLYITLYFLSATRVGFYLTGYYLTADTIFNYALPIGAIIVSLEIVRHVLVSQQAKFAVIIAYLISLIADVVIVTTIPEIDTTSELMDVLGVTLFSALIYNLLYNYISKRYGYLPIIAYRALAVWAFYLIPYGSAISKSLLAFVNIIIPIALYSFIDSFYERKRRYALKNTSKIKNILSKVITVTLIIFMAATVMLVSNHFYYGSFVIATESMTGELNRGDVAIYQSYRGEAISEGQIIVFERGRSMIIHRVVDIEIINGTTRYYTKGDANDALDAGYVTKGDIVGLVIYKLPFMGHPTLWMRELFFQ